MNILIVDDHPLVCNGIKNILHSEKEFENITEANDISAALELMSATEFNLALVDIRLKNECGIDFVNSAKKAYPDCKFVILSSSSDVTDFERALKAGVDGYILKDAFPEDIIYAVKTVLRGRKYFDPVFMEKRNIDVKQENQQVNPDDVLSPRELEILECLGNGMSNKSISNKLYISENTVKKHISSILAKLGLNDRTQAALYFSKIKGR
ncbi:MAG: response regulator [Acetivibrionales bacterium]